MSPFQLLSVDDNMLEKIIEKVFYPHIIKFIVEKSIFQLQPKEYFLLQQTCRGVKEFILSTRNVSIWLWGEYYITFKKDKKSQWQLYCCRNGLALKLKNLEVFYGLRLATMISPGKQSCAYLFLLYYFLGANKEYEQLYNSLKNYRITCDEIHINGEEWNGEQCAAIVKVVKPSRVVLYNRELTVVDFEEIFFHSKTVVLLVHVIIIRVLLERRRCWYEFGCCHFCDGQTTLQVSTLDNTSTA